MYILDSWADCLSTQTKRFGCSLIVKHGTDAAAVVVVVVDTTALDA